MKKSRRISTCFPGPGLVGLLLLMGLCAAPVQARQAAPITFLQSTIEPYLPQSSVLAMAEDAQGFLWFGTREGLGRWDGYQMQTWKQEPFNPASLPGNIIHLLHLDRHGNVWLLASRTTFSTKMPARVAAPAYERVVRYPFQDATLFLDPDHNVWLADPDSLYRYEATQDRFLPVLKRHHNVPDVGLMPNPDEVWIGAATGEMEHCRMDTGACRLLASADGWSGDEQIRALYKDAQGTLWIGGLTGLGYVDADGRVRRRSQLPTGLQNQMISRFREDAAGQVWIATTNGVFQSDPPAGTFVRHPLRLPGSPSAQNFVIETLVDRSGGIWAGTVWGLHRYDPHRKPFALFAHDPRDPQSLGSGVVISMHEYPAGTLWIGTIGGGLNRLDMATGRFKNYRHRAGDPTSLGHDVIWTIEHDAAGFLWVGTSYGLNRFDLRTERFTTYLPEPASPLVETPLGNSIHGIDPQEDGRLAVGTNLPRVLIFDPASGTFSPFPEQIKGRVESIFVDPLLKEAEGTRWFGSNEGLFRYEPKTRALTPFVHRPDDATSLSANEVMAIYRDRRGHLWVGTNNGLNRMDAATATFARFSDADGLPSNSIFAILEDDRGRIWISTNRGLARLEVDAAGRPVHVQRFDWQSGVGNVEFNRTAALKASNGKLYFGGDKGVTHFNPDRIVNNAYRPPVVIKALHKSTKTGTTTHRHFEGDRVVLNPEDYAFSFDFVALNYTNPEKNQYAAMLEGFDGQWNPLGTQRTATYTNVPPGTYTFRVKASNDDGLWNETGARLTVVVQPPFWQTWWFRLAGAVVLIAGLWTASWAVSRRSYRRALAGLRAQQALDDERARISRDMHDEVGAGLTEIAILSELARFQADEPEAVRNGLVKIADRSRAIVDNIGEIIWAINPHNDRLDQLVAYLREYAAQYLEAPALVPTLRFDPSVPDLVVSAEFRRNVFLILKESLHNIVKHARPEHVDVALNVAANQLRLRIADDGIGFTPPKAGHGGNGLQNMQQRAAEIGGTLDVASQPGQGTTLLLQVPLPRLGGAT